MPKITTRRRHNRTYEIISPSNYLELPLGFFDNYIFPLPETNIQPHFDFNKNYEIIHKKIVLDEQDILGVWKKLDPDFFERIDYDGGYATRINQIAKEYPNNTTTNKDGIKTINCICGEELHLLYRVFYGDTYVIIGRKCIKKFNDPEMEKIANKLEANDKKQQEKIQKPELYCQCKLQGCLKKLKKKDKRKGIDHDCQIKLDEIEKEKNKYMKELIKRIDKNDDFTVFKRKCEIIDNLYN